MKLTHPNAWRMIALALTLAGCSDFLQHRVGGVRRTDDLAEGPPKPAPALHIPNPPALARNPHDENVRPATFVPDRAPPPNPLNPDPHMAAHPLRVLYQRASERQAGMDSYIVRLRRREAVDGRKLPEELIRVAVKREPYSVHLKWLGTEGRGREAIYVKGKYNNKMELRLAANDIVLLPAGMRWSIAPDDALARARSRYSVTETGLASLIERYGRVVTAIETGDPREGTMKYLGLVKRPEFEANVEAVHQVLPAKGDPHLPRGGQRWWYFDATNGLPVLLITHDPDGEVEYYCHDHIQWPVRLDDDNFNPDVLWRK